MLEELTPRQIVEELDKYIISQDEAKRSVAVALRNRYRRRNLAEELREEIMPKNILMIGPTGVGKTEIARRVARLTNAPFLKVEVTKFTEVGYVGRDVESMVRDLVESAIRSVSEEKMEEVEEQARKRAEERILDCLVPPPRRDSDSENPLQAMFGGLHKAKEEDHSSSDDRRERLAERRRTMRERLERGELEEEIIEIEVESDSSPMVEIFSNAGVEEMGVNFQDLFEGMFPKKKKKRRVEIGEARRILKNQEAEKLIDNDEVKRIAIQRVEESGIIFLDELDKITGTEGGQGPDVSREGVQRDILPIVEGSTVMTKHGPVKTDHILFIAAGAFHISSPSDLIPELQGRFPIRVELKSLDQNAFQRILTEPENALIRQYRSLLAVEGIELSFSEGAISRIAELACQVNEETENIGARRLHTIMEQLLEEISFKAPELDEKEVMVDSDFVDDQLADVIQDQDLTKYIL